MPVILAQQRRIAVMRLFITCLLISTLASCATVSEQVFESPADWDSRQQHNQQLTHWSIKARLGVQSETDGGSFDVFWQQRADAYNVRLVAPMGQGAVLINGNDDGVTISLADGSTEYSEHANELFTAMTGLPLPVEGLQDWLRGMPMRGEETGTISWNEQAQLYKLEQSGWRVEMSRYKTVAEYELPHAFYLEREDQPELSVRLLVREWQPLQ